jgi:hypothetical protein
MSATIPVIGVTVKTILYLVNYIISILIWLAGQITSLVLEFNMSILEFDPPFVATGWTIFRDIANLGFVLGIIIIAVMTILRYKDYTAKQLLWKLIVAALVVNFSLVIGGIFIEASNTVSSYLLAATTGAQSGNLSQSVIAKMGDSFGYMNIVNSVSDWGVLQTIGDFIGIGSGASIGVLSALFVLIIFGIVFLFSLIAFAGMLFLRYFWLSFLLMVSPIIWLLWIFPNTKSYFKQWWDKFLKWTLYTPVVLVFVYIALAVMQNYSKYQESVNSKMGFTFNFGGDKGSLDFGALMTALFACALLIGGMKMASAMGAGGTKMVMGGWDKAMGKTKQWAKARAKWAGARVGQKTVGQKSLIGRNVQKGLVKVAGGQYKTKFGKIAGTTANVMSLGLLKKATGEAAQGLAIGQARMDKGSQKLSEEYKKNLNELSPDQIKQLLPTLNKNEQTAALDILASKDKLADLDVIKNNQNREMVLSVLRNMDNIGMGKKKGDIEKKIAATEDMLIAWGSKDGKFKKKLFKKDGSPDIDETTKKQKEEEIEYNSAADKFYSGFGKNDYKEVSKNYGDILEKIDKLTTEQERFLKPFFNRIATTDMGTGLGSFSSALKNEEQRKGFYTLLIKEISSRLDPVYKAKLDSIITSVQSNGDIKIKKLEQKDFDEVVKILKDSGDVIAKNLANKIDKSVASQLSSADDDEEKTTDKSAEKPDEKPKEDKGSKK